MINGASGKTCQLFEESTTAAAAPFLPHNTSCHTDRWPVRQGPSHIFQSHKGYRFWTEDKFLKLRFGVYPALDEEPNEGVSNSAEVWQQRLWSEVLGKLPTQRNWYDIIGQMDMQGDFPWLSSLNVRRVLINLLFGGLRWKLFQDRGSFIAMHCLPSSGNPHDSNLC